jgi:hypothetical protein
VSHIINISFQLTGRKFSIVLIVIIFRVKFTLEQEFAKTPRYFYCLWIGSIPHSKQASNCHAERRKTKKKGIDGATLAMLAARDGILERLF